MLVSTRLYCAESQETAIFKWKVSLAWPILPCSCYIWIAADSSYGTSVDLLMLQSATASLVSASPGWEQQTTHTTRPGAGSRGDLAYPITVACDSQWWERQGGVLTGASRSGSHTV
jgi:hypothetical protein